MQSRTTIALLSLFNPKKLPQSSNDQAKKVVNETSMMRIRIQLYFNGSVMPCFGAKTFFLGGGVSFWPLPTGHVLIPITNNYLIWLPHNFLEVWNRAHRNGILRLKNNSTNLSSPGFLQITILFPPTGGRWKILFSLKEGGGAGDLPVRPSSFGYC